MRRLQLLSLTLLVAAGANAQAPASAPIQLGGSASLSAEGDAASGSAQAPAAVELDPGQQGQVAIAPEHRTGFSTGLRLGVGVPLGKAGQDLFGAGRDLGDLTPWRMPVWLDVGYALSGALTIGAYAQVGAGGVGDACAGDCDWSDARLGVQAEWRFAPGAPVNPWLGAGLGYEWLSFRQLLVGQVPDGMGGMETVTGRATEHFAGPELTLQGGVDFQVEDALRIGPYASATASQYVTDSFSCTPANELCPDGGSIHGAAFHSWIGVGLRGAYTP